MLLFNTNYDSLYKQLRNIEDAFWHGINPRKKCIYYRTYQAIAEILKELDRDSSFRFLKSKNLEKDSMAYYLKNIKKNDINFLENRSYHVDMMLESYFSVSKIVSLFCNSKYSNELDNSYIPTIDIRKDEDQELLLEFFQNEAPHLLSYYEELLEDGDFFNLPNNEFFDKRGGVTVFNSIDNKANVFIESVYDTMDTLAVLPHELGHVSDFLDYRKRFSEKDQQLMIYRGIYGEVISTLYEQKFLEYYLENGKHKEDSLLGLLAYFDQRIQYLWDVAVCGMLDENDVYYVMRHTIPLQSCHEVLLENGCLKYEPNLDDENRLLCFDDALEYGYGFLLANYFLENPLKYEAFLNVRNGYFDSKKLEDIGINSKEISKSLVKRSEKIFGKYL